MFAVAVVVLVGIVVASRVPQWALPATAVCTLVSGLDFAGFDVWYLEGMVRLDHALIFGLGLAGLGKIFTGAMQVPKVVLLLAVWTICSIVLSAIQQGTPFPSGWIPWVCLIAAFLFGATYRAAFSRFSFVAVIWVAVTASAIAVGFQLIYGRTFSRLDIEGVATSGRMFNFSATLIIGLALVALAAGISASRSRSLNLVACLLLVAALLSLQQRTVWLVTVVGLVSVLWAKRGNIWCHLKSLSWSSASKSLVVISASSFVCLGAFLTLTHNTSHAQVQFTDQAQTMSGAERQQTTIDDSTLGFGDSFTDDRNLEWRVTVWKDFAKRQDSPFAWIFGEDLSRNPGFTWSPHSQYVETLRRVGVVGFVLLALVVIEAWRRRRVPGPSLASVIVPMALLAGFTYEWSGVTAILLGGCLIPRLRAEVS